jgi:hypothetical protein
MSRATECDSIYSLISIRIYAFGSFQSASASAFAVSVFPTQVGPRNKNIPIGFPASHRPALFLFTAFAMVSSAVSCHFTLDFKASAR